MSGESLECWKAEALRSREYIEKLESAITAARIADQEENRYRYKGTDEIVNAWQILNDARPEQKLTKL